MTWVLILFAYAGVMSKGDSVTMTSVSGFTSEAQCAVAGDITKRMANNTLKEIRFVCVRQ
jgi:hypothetical protein